MRILVDMNLSPNWVDTFIRQWWESCHRSSVGNVAATDREIMEWASINDWVVFTHDLDFGTLLAASGARGPSVILVRAQDVLPDHLGSVVIEAITQNQQVLNESALIVIDEARQRVRILPLKR